MPRYKGHDWDLRADGNGFVWRVFGEPGEAVVIGQGWASSRIRAEELAKAAISNVVDPADAAPRPRRSLFAWAQARP
jgi:hypothetical protein